MPEALNDEWLKARWPFGRFSGAKSKAKAAKTVGVLFPLTPALSLGEREKHSPVLWQCD